MNMKVVVVMGVMVVTVVMMVVVVMVVTVMTRKMGLIIPKQSLLGFVRES